MGTGGGIVYDSLGEPARVQTLPGDSRPVPLPQPASCSRGFLDKANFRIKLGVFQIMPSGNTTQFELNRRVDAIRDLFQYPRVFRLN